MIAREDRPIRSMIARGEDRPIRSMMARGEDRPIRSMIARGEDRPIREEAPIETPKKIQRAGYSTYNGFYIEQPLLCRQNAQ